MLIEELVAGKLRMDPKRPYPHPSSLVALHCGLEDVLQGLVLLTAATTVSKFDLQVRAVNVPPAGRAPKENEWRPTTRPAEDEHDEVLRALLLEYENAKGLVKLTSTTPYELR